MKDKTRKRSDDNVNSGVEGIFIPPGGMPAAVPDALDLIRTAASEARAEVLRLLTQGFDHPSEIAKKLKVQRQSIDKHLAELFAWGLVDRSAVFPPNGRPRIVYQITQRGRELLDLLDRTAKAYLDSFRTDYQLELEALEAKLAAGEIAEEMYFKRRRDLEGRYKAVSG